MRKSLATVLKIKSSRARRRLPWRAAARDRVEDGEQFAHAGGERDLRGLARRRAAAGRRRGSPDCDARRPARPCRARRGPARGRRRPGACRGACRCRGERGDAHEGRDLLVREPAELGQLGEQGERDHAPHAGHTLEQVVLHAPDGTRLHGGVQVVIGLAQAALQEADVLLEIPPDRRRGRRAGDSARPRASRPAAGAG